MVFRQYLREKNVNAYNLRQWTKQINDEWLTSSHVECKRFALCESFRAHCARVRTFPGVNKLFGKKKKNKITISMQIHTHAGITMCDFSDPFWVKALPQILHTYGLFPSWEIMCRVKLVPVLNSLLHFVQKCSLLLPVLLFLNDDFVLLLAVLFSVDWPTSAASGS